MLILSCFLKNINTETMLALADKNNILLSKRTRDWETVLSLKPQKRDKMKSRVSFLLHPNI